MKNNHWRKYLFEFLSIFIGVTLAFALNQWNEDKREAHAEVKILKEIKNGLSLDLKDISGNVKGHQEAIKACDYFRNIFNNIDVDQSQLPRAYTLLVRDFTSIMNKTGYESLKSKGLEIIQSDVLRFRIITLYDYYYQILYKLEEQVDEMQSFKNYFKPFNQSLIPYMKFDTNGQLIGVSSPVNISPQQHNQVLSYLWRIENNRNYKINKYKSVQTKINELIKLIDYELNQNQ